MSTQWELFLRVPQSHQLACFDPPEGCTITRSILVSRTSQGYLRNPRCQYLRSEDRHRRRQVTLQPNHGCRFLERDGLKRGHLWAGFDIAVPDVFILA